MHQSYFEFCFYIDSDKLQRNRTASSPPTSQSSSTANPTTPHSVTLPNTPAATSKPISPRSTVSVPTSTDAGSKKVLREVSTKGLHKFFHLSLTTDTEVRYFPRPYNPFSHSSIFLFLFFYLFFSFLILLHCLTLPSKKKRVRRLMLTSPRSGTFFQLYFFKS